MNWPIPKKHHCDIKQVIITPMWKINQILSPSEIICSFPKPARAYLQARHSHLEPKAAQRINWKACAYMNKFQTFYSLGLFFMQTIQNEAIRKMDGMRNVWGSPGMCWQNELREQFICPGSTVRKRNVNHSSISPPVQILSMGMMTEYYHFFFTTLVRELKCPHLNSTWWLFYSM